MPTIDIVQLKVNRRLQTTGDSSNACVSLYRLLEVLTDDQVTLQQFSSKHIISSDVLCDLRLIR